MAGGHLAHFINESKPTDETLKLLAVYIRSINFGTIHTACGLDVKQAEPLDTAPVLLAKRKVKQTSC
jgi:hypothetical protein